MVHTNDRAGNQSDLFGDCIEPVVSPTATLVKQSLPQPSKPAMPTTATAVPAKVAAKFAMSDLFSELLAVETTRNPRTFINALHDASIPQAPQVAEYVDTQVPAAEADADTDADATEGLALGTDEQLEQEYKSWIPSDEWILATHRDKLDEELVFLTSKDVKPRVWTEKAQTLQWIFTVDEIGDKNVREIPFSFHNCCLAAGHRPDDLRAALLQLPLIRELLVNLRLCHESDLPKLQKKVYYTDFVGVDSPEIPEHQVYQFPGI